MQGYKLRPAGMMSCCQAISIERGSTQHHNMQHQHLCCIALTSTRDALAKHISCSLHWSPSLALLAPVKTGCLAHSIRLSD